MKKIVFYLTLTLALLFTLPNATQAQDEPVNTIVAEAVQEKPDTLHSAEITSPIKEEAQVKEVQNTKDKMAIQAIKTSQIIPIIAIIFGTLCPVLIIFAIFYFRNKDRNRKYKVIEKAIEAGQPIPEEIFLESTGQQDSMGKGIKKIFIGLGLFVFLWFITGDLSIGSIGFLVTLIGVGEVIAAYYKKDQPEKGPKKSTPYNKETTYTPPVNIDSVETTNKDELTQE